nr:MAG TPA: hypothetical protein [Caudoviricetes sp.]
MNKFTLFMENEFNRLETAYKMTVLEESMIKNDYELAIYTESIDNINYYTEAEDKAYEKKKNIFNKMIDWFKKFFAKIRDKILSLFRKKAEKYEMWDKAPQIERGLKGFVQTLKTKYAKFKESYDYKFYKGLLKGFGILTLILNIPVITAMTFSLVSGVKANGVIDGIKGTLKDLEMYILKMNYPEYDEYKANKASQPTTLLTFLKDITTGIFRLIATAFRPMVNYAMNTSEDILMKSSLDRDEYATVVYKFD